MSSKLNVPVLGINVNEIALKRACPRLQLDTKQPTLAESSEEAALCCRKLFLERITAGEIDEKCCFLSLWKPITINSS